VDKEAVELQSLLKKRPDLAESFGKGKGKTKGGKGGKGGYPNTADHWKGKGKGDGKAQKGKGKGKAASDAAGNGGKSKGKDRATRATAKGAKLEIPQSTCSR